MYPAALKLEVIVLYHVSNQTHPLMSITVFAIQKYELGKVTDRYWNHM